VTTHRDPDLESLVIRPARSTHPAEQLGIDRHAMQYVAAAAEHIPFPDAHFDVVTSLNSLDHVDDPDAAICEIARVMRPGGVFLLEVEVGHSPTSTEPSSLWFDLFDVLAPYFDVIFDHRYEMPAGAHNVHDAYLKGGRFEMSKGRHPGVLITHLHRKG
jgi:SAM-dependent methyltransferase